MIVPYLPPGTERFKVKEHIIVQTFTFKALFTRKVVLTFELEMKT